MNQASKDYLVRSWEQVLCDKDDIIKLFEELGIKGLKNIQTLSRTYADDGRMIINVAADCTDDKTFRIIIDTTSRYPTWKQFINVTYDQGKSTDIRIILYGENFNDHRYDWNDFTAGGIIEIGNLVRRNNKCHVTTYLVKGITFASNGQKIVDEYCIEEAPNHVSVNSTQTFPSKRQVQEAEFWTGYYFPHWCTEHVGIDDDIINCWAPGYSVSNNLKTEASWNDNGFFIKLIEEKPSDALQWVWNNKKNEFEAAYPGCDIMLEKIDEDRYAISVRILNISMTDLIEMTPDEKWDYGQSVFDQEHNFIDVADGVVDDYDEMIKATSAA